MSVEAQSVDLGGGAVEKRMLLVSGIALGDALHRVPQHWVRNRVAVRREVALEHAAPRAERLDAMLVERTPSGRKLLRGRRRIEPIQTQPQIRHAKPAELDVHVGA